MEEKKRLIVQLKVLFIMPDIAQKKNERHTFKTFV